MSGIILGFFTVVLILICGYIALIVLMQRASSNAGLGAALGGGAAESALGGGASNVLIRGTIIGAVLFFVVSFGLYLGYMANYEAARSEADLTLPGISAMPAEDAADKPALPDLSEIPESTVGTMTSPVTVTAPAEATPEDIQTMNEGAAATETTEAATEAQSEAKEAADNAQAETEAATKETTEKTTTEELPAQP